MAAQSINRRVRVVIYCLLALSLNKLSGAHSTIQPENMILWRYLCKIPLFMCFNQLVLLTMGWFSDFSTGTRSNWV